MTWRLIRPTRHLAASWSPPARLHCTHAFILHSILYSAALRDHPVAPAKRALVSLMDSILVGRKQNLAF